MDSSWWNRWALVGGVLMLIAGAFRALTGVVGLFNDQWVLRGFTGYYFVDVTAVAWWMVIIGLLLLAAGLGVIAGQTWARVTGVIAITLACISELFWIPIYPIWSIMMVVVFIMCAIGLIVWTPERT